MGAKTQPCFTPLETGKGSEAAPCSITRAIIPSWKDLMMLTNLSGQPSLDNNTRNSYNSNFKKFYVRANIRHLSYICTNAIFPSAIVELMFGIN